MEKFVLFFVALWNKIIHPTVLSATISFIVTALGATLSILSVCGVLPIPEFICYAVYAVTALALAYSVYIAILSFPLIKTVVKAWLLSSPITGEFVENYDYRTLSFAIFSFVFGILFAVYHQVMAIVAGSLWFGTLFVYYLLLSLIRAITLKNQKTELLQWKKYRLCAVLVLTLTLALSGTIFLMVRDGFAFVKYDLAIYTSATYAFTRLTLSIVNIFKARKTDNPTVKALRCIGLADSLVAILSLQSTLLFAFATDDYAWANALTGAGVCIATIVIAIVMIKIANDKIKRISREENNE